VAGLESIAKLPELRKRILITIALIAVYLGLGLLGLMHIGFHGVPISLQIALFILLLTSEFFAPLRQLGAFYHARAGAIGAAKEIMPILGQNVTKNDVPFILPEKFSIKLNHISFAYRAQKPVIDKMNLEIHSAEMVAIRGPSGSGKTTLLYLVAKLILPQTGTIEVNNTNIELVSDDAWRKNIALLTQHPYFFHGSILENIKLAHPAATDEDVERVAHEAGVLEWSRLLPQGLHTIIGEKNAGLSGGQAQRVALARVLLKEAPIVLLDEPTAFLDEKNIEIIFNLFKKWKKQKTVLIATHDARVEKQVDRIIQLSEEKNERIMVFH